MVGPNLGFKDFRKMGKQVGSKNRASCTPPLNMAGSDTQNCLTELAERVEWLALPTRTYSGHSFLEVSLILGAQWAFPSRLLLLVFHLGSHPGAAKHAAKSQKRRQPIWVLLPSVTWPQRILLSLLSLCLLTWQVGGIFHFAGFLGGFPQNLTTFTFLNSPPGAFLSAHPTPARCVILSCSSLHLCFLGACLLLLTTQARFKCNPCNSSGYMGSSITFITHSLMLLSFSFFLKSLCCCFLKYSWLTMLY